MLWNTDIVQKKVNGFYRTLYGKLENYIKKNDPSWSSSESARNMKSIIVLSNF